MREIKIIRALSQLFRLLRNCLILLRICSPYHTCNFRFLVILDKSSKSAEGDRLMREMAHASLFHWLQREAIERNLGIAGDHLLKIDNNEEKAMLEKDIDSLKEFPHS